MKKKNKTAYLSIFFFIFSLSLFCGELPSKNVEKIVNEAFKNKTPYSISKSLESKIKTLRSPIEKAQALSILADYEERCELFHSACKHYLQTSELCLDKDKKSMLIKAMGSALLGSKISLAYDICNERLLPKIQQKKDKQDIKALVYFEWIKLKLLDDDSPYTIESIIGKLRSFVMNSEFAEFHPPILLTLWWLDNDKRAENTLLKKFPNSLEAGIVRGTVTLTPKVFWYLMPRKHIADADEEELMSEQKTAITQESSKAVKKETATHSAKLYQVGYFKNVDYAKRLANELAKKGFTSIVKKKKQKTGYFYSVLVKPDKKGNMVIRLKNEGYEAVPIF